MIDPAEQPPADTERDMIDVYSYRSTNRSVLAPHIEKIQERFGGHERAYSMRFGAIDLVDILTVIIGTPITFVITQLAGQYLDGFAGNTLRTAGARHRALLSEFLATKGDRIATARSRFADLGRQLKQMTVELAESPTGPNVVLYVPSIELYVACNHSHVTSALCDDLMDAVVLSHVAVANLLGESATILQLIPDSVGNTWRYLLCPSPKGFGAYCDRVIDLREMRLHAVTSHAELVALIKLPDIDQNLLIIDGRRYRK